MNARKIRAIARKEYCHLIRDFRSLILAFVIPLLMILLFGYALSLDVEHIPTAVVDHDHTPESRDFIRRLDASVYFDVVAHPPSTAVLTDLLDHNEVILGVASQEELREPPGRCLVGHGGPDVALSHADIHLQHTHPGQGDRRPAPEA